jgi:hypothetical protein
MVISPSEMIDTPDVGLLVRINLIGSPIGAARPAAEHQ